MREIRVAYSKINNAGDLLNEYLLERVFSVPYVRDVSAWTLEMTGIGSFLDILFLQKKLTKQSIKKGLKYIYEKPQQYKCVTWGTGFIKDFGKDLKKPIRKNINFMAVRGEKSKDCLEKVLGKKISPVLGDGGILVSYLLEKKNQKKYSISIIPHFREYNCRQIEEIKNKYQNIHIIDLRNSALEVIKQIDESEIILSSSLHGLIMADSLRVPNKRIYFTDKPLGTGFKFDDYYSAYGLTETAKIIRNANDLPSNNEIIDSYKVTDSMVDKMKKDMYNCMKDYLITRT